VVIIIFFVVMMVVLGLIIWWSSLPNEQSECEEPVKYFFVGSAAVEDTTLPCPELWFEGGKLFVKVDDRQWYVEMREEEIE
jgi:hypothetical protein